MTDDIVTRLRDTAYETEVCWEAACEIERLRAEVATSERLRLEDGVDSSVYIGALEAETRRLRAELRKRTKYTLSVNVVEGKNWNPEHIAEIIVKAVRGGF